MKSGPGPYCSSCCRAGKPGIPPPGMRRSGSALIVALWALMLMSMVAISLAYNMKLEAQVAGYYRARMQSQNLALAGVTWAKFMLSNAGRAINEDHVYGELFVRHLKLLKKGLAVSGIRTPNMVEGLQFEGDFSVDIEPEPGRRNVNTLSRQEWEELLTRANMPIERHAELIDCFQDWVDGDDNKLLDGAEEDDRFYDDKDYTVKNAPLDTVDELLLIKHFSDALLFGGPYAEDDEIQLNGIARYLTTWGSGKLNVNAARPEIFWTIPGMTDDILERILRVRARDAGDPEDDGFNSVGEFLAVAGLGPEWSSRFSVNDRRFVRVSSIGESGDVKTGIWVIFRQDGSKLVPVLWREEFLH